MDKEIHEKSPAETVGEFFAWMAKIAKCESRVIFGKIGEVVYEIGPSDASVGQAFDKYLKSIST